MIELLKMSIYPAEPRRAVGGHGRLWCPQQFPAETFGVPVVERPERQLSMHVRTREPVSLAVWSVWSLIPKHDTGRMMRQSIRIHDDRMGFALEREVAP